MRFRIRPVGGQLPDIPLGPPGRELGCYLPTSVAWRQLNYGQGEGQVEVEGREWGLYQTGDGGLAVVLHSGEVSAADGLAFACRVAELVAGDAPFELLLQGTEAQPTEAG
jgi:hypothetical protein